MIMLNYKSSTFEKSNFNEIVKLLCRNLQLRHVRKNEMRIYIFSIMAEDIKICYHSKRQSNLSDITYYST
jgi:hypothetical protein